MKKYITIILFIITLIGYSQNHEQIRLLTEKGNKYYQQNNIEKAEKTFKKIIKLAPLHKDTYFNLGAISIKKNDTKEAIFYYKTCVELGDLGAIDILENNLKYNFEGININNVWNKIVLNRVALKLIKQNSDDKAILFLEKASRYGHKESINLLINKFEFNESDFQFTKVEEVKDYPFYIFKDKQYEFSHKKSVGVKKFQKQLIKELKKSELLYNTYNGTKIMIMMKINNNGLIVTSVLAPSIKLNSFVSKTLIENFKFIPGKIKDENVGVGPWTMVINL